MSMLQEIVKNNDKVRPKGGEHSWSKIYEGPGIELNMKPWNMVLSLDGREIVVQAGMDLGILMLYLSSRGLTIPQMSASVGQTIGGALATATHGSSKHGTLSNSMTKAIVIYPDGSMRLSRSLGLIGTSLGNFLLYAVGLRIVPDFYVHMKIQDTNLDGLSMIYNIYSSHPDSVGLIAYYWPGIKRVRTILTYRSRDIVGATMFSKTYNEPYSDLLPYELGSIQNRVEIEEAIDVKDIIPALRILDPILPKGSILLLRFVGQDDRSYMSMTHKRNSVFISLSMDGTTNYGPIFQEMDRRLIPFNARPHWGKINYLTRSRIESLYPEFRKYIDGRRLYDPQGKFLGIDSMFR